MGSQGAGGGGFQVDNSTPDGKAKGNRDKQSLIPATIKQLKNAVPASNGEASFMIDGADLHQITIVGLITSADEQATNLQYSVDDGTDHIMVKMWCVITPRQWLVFTAAPVRHCLTLPCDAAELPLTPFAPARLSLPGFYPARTVLLRRIDAEADESFQERRAQWK